MVTEQVCIIGSGNWASAIARLVASNITSLNISKTVRMYTRNETISQTNQTLLADEINSTHYNQKYLPGIKLPENVLAVADLETSLKEATLLIFCLPHQFLRSTLDQMKGLVHPGARGVSLIKGIAFEQKGKIELFSNSISSVLNIDCSALSGANIAKEVAEGQFCESTLGYTNLENALAFREIFDCPTFRVNLVDDVAGVQVCGALKNIVAIAAGLVDGLGMGDNTKAAVIRIGLMEMMKFSQFFFVGIKVETFFESCGVADLITTCSGGRNRLVAREVAKTGKSFAELEQEMLKGQSLQGTLTAHDVNKVLTEYGVNAEYPLFQAVYKIAYQGMSPALLISEISGKQKQKAKL